MIGQLTKDQERKLAVGILGIVVVLLLVLVIVPVWSANTDSYLQIEHLQTRLHSLQARAAADAALRPRYEQLLRSHAASGHHLKSDTEAVGAAELQGIVNAISTRTAAMNSVCQVASSATTR